MELIASIREKNMQIGIVGSGRMGANMARRLMCSKHEVAVYDLKQESVATLAKEGAIGANDFADLSKKLTAEVLTAALFVRFRSRQEHTFAEKMLSAMRNKFGGHVEIYPGN
jgi:6-phosphogluconate dehydrogenase (decarboxylating)